MGKKQQTGQTEKNGNEASSPRLFQGMRDLLFGLYDSRDTSFSIMLFTQGILTRRRKCPLGMAEICLLIREKY